MKWYHPCFGSMKRKFVYEPSQINKRKGLGMNYFRIYSRIIENRKSNPADNYTEEHHIIPRSIGGSDSKDNLIRLTAREHFICHWLLVKMYRHDKRIYYKMLTAFNMMCNANNLAQHRYISCSRIFARYR